MTSILYNEHSSGSWNSNSSSSIYKQASVNARTHAHTRARTHTHTHTHTKCSTMSWPKLQEHVLKSHLNQKITHKPWAILKLLSSYMICNFHQVAC